MSFLGKKRWDVFLSHSHADAGQAKEITAFLQERGLTLWFDQDKLRVGQLFDERIKQAIVDARTVLVLVSRTAVVSDYIKHEVSCALAHNIPIAPAFLEDVPKDQLKAPLNFSEIRAHAVKLIGDDRPARLQRLADDLKALRSTAQQQWWTRIGAVGVAAALFLMLVGGLWVRGSRAVTLAEIARGEVTFAPPPGTAKETFDAQTTALDFQVFGLHRGATAWTTMRNGDALASGEHYCLRAASETTGYLYIFQQDSARKVEWIFPKNETSPYSHGTNPVGADQEINLPAAADRAYVLDDTVGTETFFAFFSATPLRELEHALKSAATTGEGVPDLPPPSEHVEPRPVLLAAKGMAGEAKVGVARTTTRQVDGRAAPIAFTPVSFQGKGHYLGVQWSIRHVPAPER